MANHLIRRRVKQLVEEISRADFVKQVPEVDIREEFIFHFLNVFSRVIEKTQNFVLANYCLFENFAFFQSPEMKKKSRGIIFF